MKRFLIFTMAILVLASSSLNAGYTIKKKVGRQNTKLTIFGFSQLEAKAGSGAKKQDNKQMLSLVLKELG